MGAGTYPRERWEHLGDPAEAELYDRGFLHGPTAVPRSNTFRTARDVLNYVDELVDDHAVPPYLIGVRQNSMGSWVVYLDHKS